MRTISLFLFLAIIFAGESVKAQYPIPSYNVAINYAATFQEIGSPISEFKASKGKRIANVKLKGSDSQSFCSARVWLYSMDQEIMLGPYSMMCEDLLSVEIDDRAWGVMVQSDDHVYVDVWIEDGSPLTDGKVDAMDTGQVLMKETLK